MYIQPLQAIDDPNCYLVSGDVEIHSSAVVAPGSILRADPGSTIAVAAGACIGMGTIVHACGGAIEVGQGVNIGAGALLVGRVTIGDNACIGSASTLRHCAIATGEIVLPGALVGELDGRSPNVPEVSAPAPSSQVEQDIAAAWGNEPVTSPPPTGNEATRLQVKSESHVTELTVTSGAEAAVGQGVEDREERNGLPVSPSSRQPPQVFGKMQVSRLMMSLFPQGQYETNQQGYNREAEEQSPEDE
jgi:carbon dioxide concentrating mechanism protein CcmN